MPQELQPRTRRTTAADPAPAPAPPFLEPQELHQTQAPRSAIYGPGAKTRELPPGAAGPELQPRNVLVDDPVSNRQPRPMASVLHLIRHGESEGNLQGKVQGQIDSPLTPLGHQQATALAEGFARRPSWRSPPVAAVYCSDLQRARDTGAAVATALGLEPRPDPRLRETSFGEMEGLSWPQLMAAEGRSLAELIDPRYVFPGGESREQALDRAWPAIEEAARAHPEKAVAVVSHGAIIAAFLRRVFGVPDDIPARILLYNTAVTSFLFDDAGFRLTCFGDTAHLESAGLPTSASEAAKR